MSLSQSRQAGRHGCGRYLQDLNFRDEVPEGSRVYLCLRTTVLAFPRKRSLPESVVVEAMVTMNDVPSAVFFSA
jgi:hypothetical protein